jgi:hypothetical protein
MGFLDGRAVRSASSDKQANDPQLGDLMAGG